MQKTQEMRVQSLGWEYPLEKQMASHSSILAWKIPWTEELSELQSMDHEELDMTEYAHVCAHTHRHICIFDSLCCTVETNTIHCKATILQ